VRDRKQTGSRCISIWTINVITTQVMGHLTHIIGQTLLDALFGSGGSEKVLLFIAANGQGYAREISRASGMGLYPIQRQLDRLETAGILASRTVGRTRIYAFNPAYPLFRELKQLLGKALSLSPAAEGKAAKEPEQAPPAPPAPAAEGRRMTQAELANFVQERLRRG
jgi:hypothetical protein